MEHIQHTAKPNPSQISKLRAAVARIERSGALDGLPPLPFGLPDLDACLPGGGPA